VNLKKAHRHYSTEAQKKAAEYNNQIKTEIPHKKCRTILSDLAWEILLNSKVILLTAVSKTLETEISRWKMTYSRLAMRKRGDLSQVSILGKGS
jgi:hypothetical protein